MSNSSVVSGVLAQALVTLPRITADELYVQCAGQIGETKLVQFKIELAKWLNDGTIPGYESRKGRYGGIYKKGSAMDHGPETVNDGPKLNPEPIATFISTYLANNIRITVSQLLILVDTTPLTEGQFRAQMSEWLNDGKTFPLFESRKGPTGGIYLRGSESEKWQPSDSDDETAEFSNGFAVQLTPSLKILHSDERNWVIQKLTGNTWVNKGYHPDLAGCLRSAVKHAINGEFSLANSLVQLKDLQSVFKDMESRIFARFEKEVSA